MRLTRRPLRCLLLAACALGLASAAVAARLAPAAGADERTDKELRKAWSHLDAGEQREVIEWFAQELRARKTPQARLLARLLGEQEQDPGFWPRAAAPPVYDPEVHAPKLPIERRPLSPGSAQVRRARKEFLLEASEDALRSAWGYDWASAGLVRLEREDDLEDAFENGLRGFGPDTDLVRALVLARLDDGSERKALAAFGHAYTDRKGRVFPGLTLFDAWSSGRKIEMPDVDALGLLHDLEDDWTSFVSPVPSSRHDELYARLAPHYEAARRHRGLREALAATFVRAEPVGLAAYGPHVPRFHTLWAEVGELPDELAPRLPAADGWQEFLTLLTERTNRSPEAYQAGLGRQERLRREEAEVRATLVRVLEEFGAFDLQRR